MKDYAAARANMVESQLRPNKVMDLRVLQAFLDVPRELFVAEPVRAVAYVDEDLPIAPGRFVMEPMVFGRLLQFAQIGGDDRVLEIGTGTGYGAALMSRLGRGVTALESDPALAAAARRNLASLNARNVGVVEGELAAGAPDRAPFDVIVFAGAVAEIPQPVLDQLTEGGRLFAVVAVAGGGRGAKVGAAQMATRLHGSISRRTLFDASAPLLPGFAREPGFVF